MLQTTDRQATANSERKREFAFAKNWRILLEQRFTARMPLLIAASTFGLRRSC